MVSHRASVLLNRPAVLLLLLGLFCFHGPAVAQVRLSLQQAGARTGPDLLPLYEDQEAIVQGQVSAKPFWALDSYFLPIQDPNDYGLLLKGSAAQFEGLAPGDWLEAQGVISKRAGLPLLLVTSLQRQSKQPPPEPRRLSLADLNSFRYLGILTVTTGQVTAISDNGGGELLTLADRGATLSVFLPKKRREPPTAFKDLNVGDKVRVTGIATQYTPLPPYDHYFQIMTPEASAVAVVQRAFLIPPLLLLTALVSISVVLAVWWIREHRMARQRRTMRTLNALSEEIIAAGSPVEILKKLEAVVPKVSHSTGVRVYVYNRRTRTLDRVPHPAEPEPASINIESPAGGLATGAAVCFRNRTLLSIPDARRSPFLKAGSKTELPRSVMFVPMFAQSELLGVLEVYHEAGVRYFTQEEQAATQHLANQVATSLKLQEQHSMREQLFRSEKLAATGQLISGVANELRAPLESILCLGNSLLSRHTGSSQERELRLLASESQRAAEIVSRLVSFAKAENAEARLVEVNGLLGSLMQFREREWKTLGLQVQSRLSPEPLYVVGAQGQLEQVFLNLLVHAEQVAKEAVEKTITVASSQIARRVVVEISYGSAAPESEKEDPFRELHSFEAGALGLGVCRGIIQTHGGEIRLTRPGSQVARFDVELPMARSKQDGRPEATKARRAGRLLTMLLVEPDAPTQRQLVTAFSTRNYRVVPISAAEEAVDLAQRLRFDVAMCSVRLPGMNWVEFFNRVREKVSTFVLITDGYDQDMARAFENGEGHILSKPLQDADLDRLAAIVEARVEDTSSIRR